jgi:hypothetical protein
MDELGEILFGVMIGYIVADWVWEHTAEDRKAFRTVLAASCSWPAPRCSPIKDSTWGCRSGSRPMNTQRLSVVIALAAALAGSRSASAQWLDSMSFSHNNPTSALLGTMINNRIMADAVKKAAERGAARSDGEAVTPPVAAPRSSAVLTFRPVAKNLMVKDLAETLVEDAASRRQLAGAFEQYLRDFEEQARKDGEPSNDVGRAAAFFVMVNYYAATGREPSDAQADGAQAIFRAGLAENPTFERMGDRDRQRLYESLVILGTFPASAVAQSAEAGHANQVKMFREFARELVKTLIGVPVEKIRLTRNGFRLLE